MSQSARMMKPVQVENVSVPSVDVVPVVLERQIFRYDMDVMVNLAERRRRSTVGTGRVSSTGAGSRSAGTRASVTCALGCRT